MEFYVIMLDSKFVCYINKNVEASVYDALDDAMKFSKEEDASAICKILVERSGADFKVRKCTVGIE